MAEIELIYGAFFTPLSACGNKTKAHSYRNSLKLIALTFLQSKLFLYELWGLNRKVKYANDIISK